MNIQRRTVPSPKGEITIFRITNDGGAWVELSSLGAGIIGIGVPDKDGKIENVALTYADPTAFFYDGPCMGKTPGRFANRIANARFAIDGKEVKLDPNQAPNALHGGKEGFQNQIWVADTRGHSTVVFSRLSPDGEEGYPGNLETEVAYSWNNDNELTIQYSATTDAPTVINLTNHAYFNLGGENSGSALGHTLRLNASRYLPTDSTQIPSGELAPVAGTPMDFTTPTPLGSSIRADFEPLHIGKGYDHCWVIDGWQKGKMAEVAVLSDPRSGRVLEVEADTPGAQVYTGNWFGGETAPNPEGRAYLDNDGVAIECQYFPDAPNHPQFPSTELRPGEKFSQTIIYRFKVEK